MANERRKGVFVQLPVSTITSVRKEAKATGKTIWEIINAAVVNRRRRA